MRDFLLDLLRFIPFAFAGYIPLLVLFGEAVPQEDLPNIHYRPGGHSYSLHRFAEADRLAPGSDVLVFGSSHACRGVDPRNFPDLSIFVMGTPAQTPLQTRMLVDVYLDKMQPKHVVYVVSGGLFQNTGVESALNLIANRPVDRHAWQMVRATKDIRVFQTFVYAGFRQWKARFIPPPPLPPILTDTYVSGGFVEKAPQAYTPPRTQPKAFVALPKQIEAFHDVVQAIQERGIPLLLVQAPTSNDHVRIFTNRSSYDTLFRSTGVPYIDFQPLVALEPEQHFYDPNHMNQQGVDRFNAVLREYFPGGAKYHKGFQSGP